MLVVIGCGNLNRSDDGVGVIVARRLLASPFPTDAPIKIFDAGTSGMDVLFQARGAQKLIIIDAASSGSEPGAIFEVPGQELENRPAPSYTLHDFRWDHALYAGKQIWANDFPSDVTVFLIEAASLSYGLDLSPEVLQAAEIVTARVSTLIANYYAVEASMSAQAAGSGRLPLHLYRDHLYIEAAAFSAHLARIGSVALLRDNDDLLILPILAPEAGGFLVKQVNARGDRAIHTADFFRLNAIDETRDISLVAWPRESIAGFVVPGLFANSQTKFAIRK